MFIRDLIHDYINSPDLLQLINYYAPARSLRANFHFHNNVSKNCYAMKETLFHCTEICNLFLNHIDIFQCFKNSLLLNFSHISVYSN